MKHHYKDPTLGFGVSTKFWDFVFGTQLAWDFGIRPIQVVLLSHSWLIVLHCKEILDKSISSARIVFASMIWIQKNLTSTSFFIYPCRLNFDCWNELYAWLLVSTLDVVDQTREKKKLQNPFGDSCIFSLECFVQDSIGSSMSESPSWSISAWVSSSVHLTSA